MGILRLFLSLLVIVLSAELHSEETLSLSFEKTLVLVGGVAEESDVASYFRLLYRELFSRLNMHYELRFYPVVRAAHMSEQGYVDGELARLGDYGDRHPELIRVEPSIASARILAVAADPDLNLNGWQSLLGKGYVVNFRRGHDAVKYQLGQLLSAGEFEQVSSVTNGLKKVEAGRATVYVDDEYSLNEDLFFRTEINRNIFIAGLIDSLEVYLFIHQKNRDLIPKLSAALSEMKKEGVMERYRLEASNQRGIIQVK